MKLSREYPDCLFDADVIRSALRAFQGLDRPPGTVDVWHLGLADGSDEWEFDSIDDFFAHYRRGCRSASFRAKGRADTYQDAIPDSMDVGVLVFSTGAVRTTVSVERPRSEDAEALLSIFGAHVKSATQAPPPIPAPPPPPAPRIFIGHGRSDLWRDLRDHLADQHGYEVETYETGARSGHTIRDILDGMAARAAFAILVMTAEDEQADGALRARQNVVHETGLFQGRLGFDRALVVVERGVESYSNLDGIQQIRFAPSNIREAFGDVLATLHREFGHGSGPES